MSNDFVTNHSSKSSNMHIANLSFPHLNNFIRQSYKKDKTRAMFDTHSKGNKTIFFDSDNEKRPSNQKELLIAKTISQYPTNYAPVPTPNSYEDGVIRGYYIKVRKAPRFEGRLPYQMNDNYYGRNIENGGEEYEEEGGNQDYYEENMDVENGNQFSDESPPNDDGYYNNYIGGGNVRNNISNFTPNPHCRTTRYYKKKPFINYTYDNYNNYGRENEIEDNRYFIESPKDYYDINRRPYKNRHILGNLGDSASSEAYANKKNRYNHYSQNLNNSSRIYIKPRTKYKSNSNIINNGISTEERGIESQRSIPSNVAKNNSYFKKPYLFFDSEGNTNRYNKINNYDEDSVGVSEPSLYARPLNEKKRGIVNLKHYDKVTRNWEEEDEEDDDDKKEDLEKISEMSDENLMNIIKLQRKVKSHMKDRENKIIKIQSIWRGRGTRKIMKLYHDLEEFIFLISIVSYNHFSDNFFFFINQLFNVYKAKTLKNQTDSNEEEKEDNQNENEQNKEERDEDKDINDKTFNKLLNDYNILQEKINDLSNDKNNISTIKKNVLSNDITSAPGETTFGTIKTDTHKIHKFKPQSSNISVSNIEYNDETGNYRDYNRDFFTPNQRGEDSFNESSKDKRLSYSEIQGEENNQYFDNEHPGRGNSSYKSRNISLKHKIKKKPKVELLNFSKTQSRLYSYSPLSRGNSSKRKSKNDSQIENKINNISIVPKHEDEFAISDDPNKLVDDIYKKYINNFSKDLRIVKNNKINVKNKDDIRLYCFDNELMYPENENCLELIAPKKTDEQKIKDILDNDKLLKKMKKMMKPKKKNYILHFGDSILLKNDKNTDNYLVENKKNIKYEIAPSVNNIEILPNGHRKFESSKLYFESNELSLGEEKILLNKKKNEKLKPILENEIKITEHKKLNTTPLSFSKEKILPTFNDMVDKNAFTIKNNIPKMTGFPNEKMIIDRIYNNDISLIESKSITRNKPDDIKKQIIYVPFTDNVFKKLRKSRRTKDTYFTINGESIDSKNKDNVLDEKNNKNKELSKTNENNFEIKNIYYYVEVKDEDKAPQIIEKKVVETIILEKPIENSGKFNNEKIMLSNEDNFNIKADKNKNKYLEDIEKNELIIPSEIKKNKKIQKKWEDLNPIANNEFEIENDYELSDDSDKILEDKDENNISFDIVINEQFEIIDKKKDKQTEFIKSKENDIKLSSDIALTEEKDIQVDIAQNKTKFLNNENTVEDTFSIYGNKKDNERNEIALSKDTCCQLKIKRKKKSLKDNETETDIKPLKEFDNIEHMANEDFAIQNIKKDTKEEGTEMTDELNDKNKKEIKLENVKNENIKIKGKKKKMKESETEIDNELNKIEPNNNYELMYYPNKTKKDNIISKGDNFDLFSPEKEIILEPSKIENINLESKHRSFPRLDMNNCLNQTINGKEKPILYNIKNESFMIKTNKKKIKFLIEFDEFKIRPDKNRLKKERSFNGLDINKTEEYNIIGKKKKKKRNK